MNNSLEKIFKRKDGSRVKVSITLRPNRISNLAYIVDVRTCKKGKRTWKETYDSDCYTYRGLSLEDRSALRDRSMLEASSVTEIKSVAMALWKELEPHKIEGELTLSN